MRTVTVAATRFACSWDLSANASRAEALIRQAAGQGAEVILIQGLFAAPHVCIERHPRYFDLALPAKGHPLIARTAPLWQRNWAWSCRSASSDAPGRPSSTPSP